MSTVVLEARGVTRRFGRMAALDEASLELHAGEIAALIGPSGSGKSTLLRVMAGLEPVDAGEVREAGALVSSARARVPAERRQIGLVFQDFALFPHLDARANVAFGLTGKADALRQAEGWLGKVGLAHKARAFPHQLSGGEQQRVALARALAPQPRALLLDEPFSGLDPFLRADLQESTVETLRATGTSALVVSHDTEEALAIADRVAVMDRGRVAQTGAPSQVHDNPASLAVARALGPICTLPAHADGRLATTPLGTFPTALSGPAILAARPEAIALAPDPHGAFTITSIRGVGLHRTIHLTDGTHRLIAFVDLPLVPPPGARVTPTIAPGSAHVFADPAG